MWDWIERWIRTDRSRPPGDSAPIPLPHIETAGAAYSELIEAELSDESERRQGIERRAQTVISSVGAIFGLAIAIASLAGLGASFSAAQPSPSPSPSQVVVDPATASPTAAATPIASLAVTSIAVDPVLALSVGGFAFLLAILFALYALVPQNHEVAQIDALERLTQEQFWSAPRALGSRRASEVRVRELRTARIANARKAKALALALIFEVLGIGSFGGLALSVLATLARR